jgi:RNA polymerase subunit RPABC4/transcription elongation factor Spt4
MNWNNVSLVVLGLAAFFGAFFVALWASLVIWTFRDMRARTRDAFAQFLASLMVLVLGPFGIILYFVLRPRETLSEKYERSLEEEALLQDIEERQICPGCKQPIEPDYVLCPICHTHLRTACIHCGRLIHPRWDLCPYCAQGQEPVPGLDRAANVTLQDLGEEPEARRLEPAPDETGAEDSAPEPDELPEELLAELQKEAEASMTRASLADALLDDDPMDDVLTGDPPVTGASADETDAHQTRKLRLPVERQKPPQPPESQAAEQADPADSNAKGETRQPLSLFRRR